MSIDIDRLMDQWDNGAPRTMLCELLRTVAALEQWRSSVDVESVVPLVATLSDRVAALEQRVSSIDRSKAEAEERGESGWTVHRDDLAKMEERAERAEDQVAEYNNAIADAQRELFSAGVQPGANGSVRVGIIALADDRDAFKSELAKERATANAAINEAQALRQERDQAIAALGEVGRAQGLAQAQRDAALSDAATARGECDRLRELAHKLLDELKEQTHGRGDDGTQYCTVCDWPTLRPYDSGATTGHRPTCLIVEAESVLRREALSSSPPPTTGEKVPWSNAGGPNECAHGYAQGIPCPLCGDRQEKPTPPPPSPGQLVPEMEITEVGPDYVVARGKPSPEGSPCIDYGKDGPAYALGHAMGNRMDKPSSDFDPFAPIETLPSEVQRDIEMERGLKPSPEKGQGERCGGTKKVYGADDHVPNDPCPGCPDCKSEVKS